MKLIQYSMSRILKIGITLSLLLIAGLATTFLNSPTILCYSRVNIYNVVLENIDNLTSFYKTRLPRRHTVMLSKSTSWFLYEFVRYKPIKKLVYTYYTPQELSFDFNKQNFFYFLVNTKVWPFSMVPDHSYFMYFVLLWFVLTCFFVTICSSYLGLNGCFFLLFISLSSLAIGLVWISPTLCRDNTQLWIELKIYTLYLPTALTTITFGLDRISAAFATLVITISVCALIYSRIYLATDPNAIDFLIKLVWFVISMLLLVIAKNCFLIYFFWEGIGITSAWLINFNSQRLDTLKSALKAFIFNKISDLSLFSALLLGYWTTNTTNIDEWNLTVHVLQNTQINLESFAVKFSVLMLIAACVKSAQIFFHIWLPDSMDAPVPASALIHSATLVSAGVYLLLRFNTILQLGGVLPTVAGIGAITAAYGGLVAGSQTDLKRGLAYSTISHCGFLFILASTANVQITLLYLFLHGFFKALSFMCAGELIRMGGGYQDINKMGGFFFLNPLLCSQLLVSMANLCGLPLAYGYMFKSNFQKLLIFNWSINIVFTICATIGLLASMLYFIRIFWATTFHYKKFQFKTQSEFFNPGVYDAFLPIKTPKSLMIIFWFIYFLSGLFVFYIFTTHSSWFLASSSEFYTYTPGIQQGVLYAKPHLINYFFFFYNIFFWVACSLLWNYPLKTTANQSLFKYGSNFFFIFFFFFFF